VTRRSGAFVAAVALALACVAGTRAETPAGIAQVRQLTSGGLTRTYRAVHPASAGAHPPLVMIVHGGFGTGKAAEDAYGWDAVAGAHGFVVVYPDGFARSWNAGRCCGQARERNLDDVAFLTAVIRDAERRDGIDPSRIYVAGLSNGAIMAYRLACEGPIPLAAIGPVAGDLEVPCEKPAALVSVLAIHGTADQNVPVGGGFNTKGFTKTEHTSVAASLARWRAIDSCDAPQIVRKPPLRTETSGCAGGSEVELILVEGAGHQWPGSKPPPAWAARLLGLDQPSTALDATAVLWAFFSRH
jgi:polyhydroxybutyrate depolymerase